MHDNFHPITCPACHKTFHLIASEHVLFCANCGASLEKLSEKPTLTTPGNSELLSDRYQLIESIGKGGMGEVFLAFDTVCGRRIALKKIRSDLIEHPQIRHRFLKEAHITCQLTHPAIIPIYSIQALQASAFYTMPFVEGKTLKQILRQARQLEKKGEKADQMGGSIAALMRVFITICQAIAYAHSKGVLHRDIKPENIIIGKYGEVLILDWGLAKFLHGPPADEEESSSHPSIQIPHNAEITKIGKVVGTVAYMAPERALGEPASLQSDIYALGVILYQVLALRMPFHRSSLEQFRKTMNQEEWIDPVLVAPYRDVPRMLSRMTEKCLQSDPKLRYQTVDELIYEIENYLEGRSEWFHVADLDIKRKEDWEFQEHVLIAEHIAITRIIEEAEWVNLMIAQQSFTGNTRIDASICLGDEAHGIGILISIPEASDRAFINEGYCLWLSSDLHRSTKLLRSNVEVMEAPDIVLKRNQWTNIRIEKVEKTIHLFLNDVLQFSYIAHLPLIGTHVGLLSRDADFQIQPIQVFVGSLNLTVNCLAVPDAFLAHRDFAQALSEYRRIAYSFPDRAEGREAHFRAGLTFIEQAKGASNKTELLDKALQEFEKLHGTPGGPLEYLGKALVYQSLQENEEEIKCFEIAYRRYPNHPLLLVLQEQILSRLHEVSRQNRITSYRFLLLTSRYFASASIDTHTRRLFSSLYKHWEPLPFIEDIAAKIHPSQMRRFALPLAFWLAKPYILGEIIDELLPLDQASTVELQNALTCLIELGAPRYAQIKLNQIKETCQRLDEGHAKDIEWMIACACSAIEESFQTLVTSLEDPLDFSRIRLLLFALDQAIDQKKTHFVHEAMHRLNRDDLPYDALLRLNIRTIWAYLQEKNWDRASEFLYTYPLELLNAGTSPLHFLYGCWLQATEGKEIATVHFSGLFHAPYPRSWNLASHYLTNDLQQRDWLGKAFLWEKRQLYRQLSLYYHCTGAEDQSQFFDDQFKQQYIVETEL